MAQYGAVAAAPGQELQLGEVAVEWDTLRDRANSLSSADSAPNQDAAGAGVGSGRDSPVAASIHSDAHTAHGADASQPLLLLQTKRRTTDKVRRKRCLCCFPSRSMCVSVVLLSGGLAIIGFALLARFVILPSFVQHYIQTSVLMFDSVNLTAPHQQSVHMDASAVFPRPPASVDVKLTSPGVDVSFYRPNSHVAVPVGHFSLERPAALHPTGKLLMSCELTITNDRGFSNMTKALFREKYLTWRFDGLVDLTVTVLGVTLTLDHVRLDKDVSLQGCNNLPDTHVVAFDVSQVGDDPVVSINITVVNPSPIAILPIGDVKFLVSSNVDGEDVLFGPPVVVRDMALLPGLNMLQATGVLRPSNPHVADQLFTQYLQGMASELKAVVPADGTTVPLYSEGLEGLALSTTLPGNTDEIIQSGTGVANFSLIFKLLEDTGHVDIPVRLVVNNPFHVDLTMFAVEGFVLFNGTHNGTDGSGPHSHLDPVGFVNLEAAETPNITIPAASTFFAPVVPIECLLGQPYVFDDIVFAFLQALSVNESHVSITTNISIQVGTTSLMPRVSYDAVDIPLYIGPADEA